MRKDIIDQYHKLSLPTKAAVWFILCQFLQKGIGFLTTPLFTRMLTTREYGRMSVFFSWESIFILTVTLSSGKAILILCSKFGDSNSLLSSVTGLNITLAIVSGILICFFLRPIIAVTGLTKTLIYWLYLHCAFQSIISCWILFNQYRYSYKIVVLETLAFSAIATFGGLVSVILISRTAEARIIPQSVVAVVLGLIIMSSIFRKSRKFVDVEIWKFTLGFCVPLLPHYLSEIILINADRIMIDKLCGSSDVAVYSVAYSVGSLITMVTNAINSAFAPYQYHKIKEGDYRTLAVNTNYIMGFVALCLCVVMLFSREIVLIFGGDKYFDSASLIIPISLGVFFNYMFQLFARVQEYFEQKYTIVIASVSCATLNIILNDIFIRRYGYRAAAYTTFFCYFSFCLLHYVFYRMACKKIGQEIYSARGLAIISIVLMAMSIVIDLINDSIVLKYIFFAILLILVVWKQKKLIGLIGAIKKGE